MSKQPGSHNTPRAVVEEILRLHIEEGYSYRQLAEKFQKPFKTIQNMIHNEYKKQRQLLECGKVPRSASTFLNPTTEQYLGNTAQSPKKEGRSGRQEILKYSPESGSAGRLNQAARQGLSARIRFARANTIFSLAV